MLQQRIIRERIIHLPSHPGRPRREFPAEPFEVQFSPENMLAMRTLFRDPTTKRGIKHGAISSFVNNLCTAYFRQNPVVSSDAMKAALTTQESTQ